MAILQCQVQELQSQVEENQATSTRIVELEVEFQGTMAREGEMFFEGQDMVKKELVKWFSSEAFSWIDDIFPKEERDEDEQEEEGQAEDNSID